MLLMISTFTGYAKCYWNDYTLSVYYKTVSGQREYHSSPKYKGNVFWGDSCVKVNFSLYDHETKNTYNLGPSGLTLYPNEFHNRITIYCKISNICENCDTTYSYTIEAKNFNKFCFGETKQACGRYLYEMCDLPNTDTSCKYNYYYTIWAGSSFNSLTQKQWDTLTAQYLGFMYSYPRSELLTEHDGRGFAYQFPRNGRYLLVTQVISCFSDTMVFEKVTIDCMAGVEDINKPEPKLIGTYDMLGRRVDYLEPNQVYIVLYSNGKRQKVVKTK